MAFKTVKDNQAQNNLLAKYHRIQKHQKPFILDRYINPVLKLFSAFQRDFQGSVTPFKVVQNTYKKKKFISLLTYQKQDQVKKEIEKLLKDYPTEKVTVHFSENKSAKGFYKKIKEFNKSVGLYNSETKEDIKNKQIKVTTSSLSRGYSLSSHSTYLIDSGRTVGVMTLLQMIDRARDSKAVNLYLRDGTTKNDTLNTLYSKYKDLSSYDYVLRIREFLRLVKKMEDEHQSVLKFMILDTYNTGIEVTNVYDLIYVRGVIDSNWDNWVNSNIDLTSIIKMIKGQVEIKEEEIVKELKVKRLVKS